MRKLFVIFFLLSGLYVSGVYAQGLSASGQGITVTSHIDSTSMWIGNQTNLSFQFVQSAHKKVITPIFSDTIVNGLEIVGPMKADTTTSSDGRLVVTQNYKVTAFQDSLIYIPRYPFIQDSDTVWSNSLSLKMIQPFKIDTASHKIAGIKNVFNTKFYWKGLFETILIVLLVLILLFLIYYLIRKYVHKKPVFESIVPKVQIPPFELAMSKLNKIKEEKIWQHNRIKEFHTELTETVREYIETAMDINAMESTSDEILQDLNHLRFENKTAFEKLKQILKLADLVKFAKWNPGPDEHELSLNNAYEFVQLTKVEEEEEVPEEEKKEETEKNNDNE